MWPFVSRTVPADQPDTPSTEKKFSVLFVCMGNICRSPTAEGVLRHKLKAAGLDDRVAVDSCGTHAHWHEGKGPDPRSLAHAKKRGYDLSALRARRLAEDDFHRHDLILVMDEDNWAAVHDRCAPELRAKLARLGHQGRVQVAEIPDPYYGPAGGFDRVLDLVEAACDGLVERLTTELRNR
jgi:protein-tyrosine phosphatase